MYTAAVMRGMPQEPTPTRPALRAWLAILAAGSAVVAVVATISQLWLTAVGSSMSAAAMVALFWNTRPRRTG